MARLDDRFLVQMIGEFSVVLVDSDTGQEVVFHLTSEDLGRVLRELKTPAENFPDMRRVTGRESLSDNSLAVSVFVPDTIVSELAFWLGYFYSRSSE